MELTRGTLRAFKQRSRRPSRSPPGNGLGEQDRSDRSVPPSDEEFEDLSDEAPTLEMVEQNTLVHKEVVAQVGYWLG